ncbi:MAG: twin-arginine translocase TatA/TatE family subunit [Gammaproteobacteria bacterium]
MLSFSEICMIAIIALLAFGPKHLPQLAQRLGQLRSFLQNLNGEVRGIFDQELKQTQLQENIEKAQQAEQAYTSQEKNTINKHNQ